MNSKGGLHDRPADRPDADHLSEALGAQVLQRLGETDSFVTELERLAVLAPEPYSKRLDALAQDARL